MSIFEITHTREDAVRALLRDRCELLNSTFPGGGFKVREFGANGLQIVGDARKSKVYVYKKENNV